MYQKIYFYIDSDYQYSRGFSSDAADLLFHTEVKSIFESIGWRVEPGRLSGSSPSAFKGKQELYLHPMSFSGVILSEDIPEIEGALRTTKTFRLRNVGRFEQYEDMSDERYRSYLDTRRDDMIKAILEFCQTKRRNLYRTGNLCETIGKQFKIHRLQTKNNSDGDLAYLRVAELVAELLTDGKLVFSKTKNGPGFRTATPKDKPAANEEQVPVPGFMAGRA